jgi:hypothetical protein
VLVLLLAAIFGPLALVALDAGLRRGGLYDSTIFDWPRGYRDASPARFEPSPYREGQGQPWAVVLDPGIPRATSILLPPVVGITLLWALASFLAFGDLLQVARGSRPAGFAFASLGLCLVHLMTSGAALLAAWGKRPGAFYLASALALVLDGTLAALPIPCSDIRADDVHMGLAGLAAHGLLTLGFTLSIWWRRGLLEVPETLTTEGDIDQ